MTPEAKIYHILPRTKQLLQEDIKNRKEEATEISKEGADLWEGDQWHSTAYREQQNRKEIAIRYLQLIDNGTIFENLSKPKQVEHVEIGHMIKVKLLDDPDAIEARVPYTLIHIFTHFDSKYLDSQFDGVSEIIVSNETPIGKALIGRERGDKTTYLQNLRLEILNSEDAIQISSLFEK
ncbi:MAG: hypothetical protein ABIG91_02825 [Patescibacteria group bacterium]